MLTVVMYHYVRDLPNTPYPAIRGLLTSDFEGQLDYIGRHYRVCSLDEVIAAALGGDPLPRNACLLTFDDGLLDHYETVLPRLLQKGMPAAFFPTGEAVEQHVVMDVHKLHFILAVHEDPAALLEELLQEVDACRPEFSLPDRAELLAACTTDANRYDSQIPLYIKRLLQRVLPKPLRRRIAAELFRRHVTPDEVAFALGLYLSVEQLRTMTQHGMGIGGHGYEHDWLELLDAPDQAFQFRRSRAFVGRILGREPDDWAMNYPYGSHNATTLQVAATVPGCRLGFTTRPLLMKDFSSPFETPRIDTNDLPHRVDAALVSWTKRVC